MGIQTLPAASAAGKTMYRTTLYSGTSYTVPTGVSYLNVTLVGGGGGGPQESNNATTVAGNKGQGGQIVSSNLSVTAGASITYAIGAGGTAPAGAGGTTTFTGATSAAGGNGQGRIQAGAASQAGLVTDNGGNGAYSNVDNSRSGGVGGAGCIVVEYWV